MFKCTDCQKVIRTVRDVRECDKCQSRGTASAIPARHSDNDWMTPALMGYMLGGGFSGHSHSAPQPDDTPAFSGGGGDSGGAGASSSWDSGSSSSSSDSGSSSSDSGSGSSDSGSSSSSSSD